VGAVWVASGMGNLESWAGMLGGCGVADGGI
jgi:hypothetical protein